MNRFFALRAFDTGISAENGILRAQDLEELGISNHLVAEAKRQAEEITLSAKAAYETEKRRGFEEGLAEAQTARAAQLLEDQRYIDARLASLERDLGLLVFNSVKNVIDGFEDETLACEVARSALAAMRKEQRGQLYVSPENLNATQNAITEIVEEFPEIELIDVIADPDLVPPNVRLESPLGVVAFSMTETLETLRQNLTTK